MEASVSQVDDSEFLRTVLDSLLTGVYVVNRNGKVLLWNSAAERMTGYLRHDVVGHPSPVDVVVTADANYIELLGEAAPVAIALRDGKPNTRQVSLLHKDGHRVPTRLHTVPLRDGQHAIIAAVESFSDYVAAQEADPRRSKLARYGCLDPVSGVLTHTMLQAHLREALATFAEQPVPLATLCVGINGLDAIRARHGQAAIDAVLRVVGQTVECSLRPTDFVGRWLENQFLAILTECNEEEVNAVTQRVRRLALQSKVAWWGDSLTLDLSMGSTSVQQGDTAETLVERAEMNLRANLVLGAVPIGLSQ
jgi:PAS domain S-box-containing protein/diguanylate cyclase (GGDEF)-like protein